MSFVNLLETKAFLSIKSPNQDDMLATLVDGVNSLLSALVDPQMVPKDTSDMGTTTESTVIISHETGRSTSISIDLSGMVIGGATPLITVQRLVYKAEEMGFAREEVPPTQYQIDLKRCTILPTASTGSYELNVTTKIDTKDLQALKNAALQLIRHYYKEEYKQTQNSGTQSVTYTPTVGNIPTHIRLLLEPFRSI